MAAESSRSGSGARRSSADIVADLVLYAPLGLVDVLRRDLPRLVRRGRTQFEQQVRTARWVGEMAVRMGQSKLASEVAARRRAPRERATPDRPSAAAPAEADAGLRLVEPVAAEPFPGYDTLPAVDLVPLLGRLSRDELEAVRGYETSTRNRRTVLARVEQLLAA